MGSPTCRPLEFDPDTLRCVDGWAVEALCSPEVHEAFAEAPEPSKGAVGEQMATQAGAACVRSALPLQTPPVPRFTRDAYGVVTDAWTGAVWMGNGPASPRPLMDAIGWCVKLELAGRTWRLPTVNEAASLIDRAHDPAIDYVAFTMGGVAIHSISATAADISKHWTVDFTSGAIAAMDPDGEAFVRCISGP